MTQYTPKFQDECNPKLLELIINNQRATYVE